MTATDERLFARLRELALVDVDALLEGTGEAARARLSAAYAEDIEDALGCARARAAELRRVIAAADPMLLLDRAPEVRVRDGSADVVQRSRDRLLARAAAGRTLARLDALAAELFPRLVQADRLRVRATPGATVE